MKNVIYAKYSRERREEFQIATLILEDGEGEKTVRKQALHEKAFAHVEAMAVNAPRLARNYQSQGLRVCPCKRDGEGRVSFPFIRGENMDQFLAERIAEGDFKQVKEKVGLFWQFLSSQKDVEPFVPGEKFREIFGEISLPDGLTAAPVSNLDMVFSNILMDGEGFAVTDYEWVFDFPVPIQFLFARSLLLQGAIQTLSREQQEELYALGGVKLEERSLYHEMEVCFQKYVTGREELNVLSRLHAKMGTDCYFLDYWNTEHLYYRVRLLGIPRDGSEPVCLHESRHFQGTVEEKIQVPDTGRYRAFTLLPVDTEAILKINRLEGTREEKEEKVSLTYHNGQVKNGDAYYFKEPPRMEFENREYHSLTVEYVVWHRNHFLIGESIDLRVENEQLRRELGKYTGRLHNRVIRKIGRLLRDRRSGKTE